MADLQALAAKDTYEREQMKHMPIPNPTKSMREQSHIHENTVITKKSVFAFLVILRFFLGVV